MSLNKVMLIGNAGKDPEIRRLESGSVVARVSLATTERFKDRKGELQEHTEWHNIVCWGILAERMEKYVRRGSQLFIEGKLRTRSWEDKTGVTKYTVEISADNFQLLGRRESDSTPQNNTNIDDIIPREDDGDLPF